MLVVSIWFLFVPIAGADATYLLICIAGMYIGTTLIGLPYGAWGAELSPDYVQRARVTAWREQFTLIGLLVAAFIPFLVEQYGDGSIVHHALYGAGDMYCDAGGGYCAVCL